MTDLFRDIIPSILHTKKDVLEDPDSVKEYLPFIVNKALSHYPDCLLFSNMMNLNNSLPPKAQYDYLINTVRAMKRPYTEWYKPQKDIDLEAVKVFFGYSTKKAKEALKILTREQIDTIKKKTEDIRVTK